MKLIKHVISLFLILLFVSGCNRNAKRNKINFHDDTEQVRDSILRISTLLDKLPYPNRINKGYDFRDNKLFVNNLSIDTTNVNVNKALLNLSLNEKKQLIRLTQFLKANNLTSGSFDTYLSLWAFEYDYLPDGDNDDARVISVLNGFNRSRITSKVKVLDRRLDVYLLKYK